MFRRSQALGGVLCLMYSGAVLSLEATFSATADVEHSNNSRKEKDGQSELEQNLVADMGLYHDGNQLDANVNYNAKRTRYDKDTQDDNTEVTGDAQLTYEQIAQTLIWSFSNSRRSVVRDKSLDDIQDNREERSISEADVRFTLRPSGVDSLSTVLSYSDVRYDDAEEQDSDSAGVSLIWNRKLSKIDNVYINTRYQDVSFEDGVNDYEYYVAGIGYSAALSKLSYEIYLGYNEQDREADSVGGGYYRIDADYRASGSTWSLGLLHQLTDTSRGDNNVTGTDSVTNGNLGAEIDSYTITRAELDYGNDILCASCTLGVSLIAVDEDYEVLADDNTEYSLSVKLSYRFTPHTTFSASARYSDFNFKGLNTRSDYDLVRYGLAMNQQFGKNLALKLAISYEDKSSDETLEEYDELRGGISLKYTFL